MRKRREAAESSSIRSIFGGLYKAFCFQLGELKTRLLGAREESWGMVVFDENGMAREVET